MKLTAESVRFRFGGHEVLKGISFVLDRPEVCGMIGPNGAGKSTLTNVLHGVLRPTGGAIWFDGHRVDGLPTYAIVRRGFGRTFQIPRLFGRMTVAENLAVPALATNPRQSRAALDERIDDTLDLARLSRLRNERAHALSGGQKKLLELARLVMLDAEIMMLDEPFAGIHPHLQEVMFEFIRRQRELGKAFIVISHEMPTVFALSDRLLVLSDGQIIADGSPLAVKSDPAVISAYVGVDDDHA